jgi:cyclophilin family peptidyl-prolyl cis-trans isomerase
VHPRWLAALAAALLMVSGVAVGDPTAPPTAPDPSGVGAANVYVNSTVTIDTNFGVIVAMLYDEGAPITASNFINLSVSGFYDGIKFHRIIDDFVIQTGDPNSKDSNPYNDGTGGSSTTIPLEINENLTHEDGALGMARSNDPNSASSQFYICDGAQNQLDGNYAVFGIVVEGIEVVRTIASQPTWGYKRPLLMDHPVNDIVMNSVVIAYGFWNNTTAPDSGGGGLGAIFTVAGGAGVPLALLGVVVLGGAIYLIFPRARGPMRKAVDRLRIPRIVNAVRSRIPARLRRA